MTIREDFISEIVKRVIGVAQPEKILLFGSAAMGEMSSDSDIDLLVLESSTANTRNESVRLRNALRGLGVPFDVVVMKTDRFEETKDVIGGLAYPANRYGKVIYEVT